MAVTWERFLETSPIEVISPHFQPVTALELIRRQGEPARQELGRVASGHGPGAGKRAVDQHVAGADGIEDPEMRRGAPATRRV